MVYVLAIDGGGTSTVAVVADENGVIYSKVVLAKSNPTTISKQQFEYVLTETLEGLRQQNSIAFSKVSCCFAGLSGVKEMNFEIFTESIFRRYYSERVSIIIENDACIALYSGTLGLPGIVQIAGTGAITYAVDSLGKKVRVGGWGYLFDDEGSGYEIAVQALKSIVKAYDQRGPQTALTSKILMHFNIEEVPQIIDCIYNDNHPRSNIAPLSKYVEQAAIEGDKVAKGILEQACEHYLNAILACKQQTVWDIPIIPIVLAGGVFTNFTVLEEILSSLATSNKLPFQFIEAKLLPIGGAVIGALKQLQVHESTTFIEEFTSRFHVL